MHGEFFEEWFSFELWTGEEHSHSLCLTLWTRAMMQAAQSISPVVWAVSTLPGMHFKLESLTKAKQV